MVQVDPYPTPRYERDSKTLQGLVEQEARRKFALGLAVAMVLLCLLYFWLTKHRRLAKSWGDGRSRWQRLVLQASLEVIGAIDFVFYWIRYPFGSAGWQNIRALAAPLFSIQDKTHDEYTSARQAAMTTLLAKREVDRKLFVIDTSRASTAADQQLLNEVGREAPAYESRAQVAKSLQKVPRSVLNALDALWAPIHIGQLRLFQAARRIHESAVSLYASALLNLLGRIPRENSSRIRGK